MTLINTIVDANYKLIGFMVEGTEKEFGGVSNQITRGAVSIKRLFELNFSNEQIRVANGVIQERNKFRINTLSMVMLKEGKYDPINNTLTLVKRYVNGRETIGFTVFIGNISKNLMSKDIIKMSTLFKPSNFTIRTTEEGKKYIVGTMPGGLSTLPTEDLATKKKKSTIKPLMDVDIIDIYDYVRKAGGFIINLPNEMYKSKNQPVIPEKEFQSMHIGEIAYPALQFTESKFNASTTFRKPGIVRIETSPGDVKEITTFIIRKKNIFSNGESYISRLGILLESTQSRKFVEVFGSSLKIVEITDDNIVNTFGLLAGQPGMKLLAIDIKSVPIVSSTKYDKYIMPTNVLFDKVFRMCTTKLMIKYLNAMLKEFKEEAHIDTERKKDIAPALMGMTSEELTVLRNSGFDIYSGAYVSAKASSIDSEKEDNDANDIEVVYGIDGVDANRITYKQMVECSDKLPKGLTAFIRQICDIENLLDRIQNAKKWLDKLEPELAKLRREIWLHKCCMWLNSGKKTIHVHDRKHWELNTKKRAKATYYSCTIPEYSMMQMALKNIDLQ